MRSRRSPFPAGGLPRAGMLALVADMVRPGRPPVLSLRRCKGIAKIIKTKILDNVSGIVYAVSTSFDQIWIQKKMGAQTPILSFSMNEN